MVKRVKAKTVKKEKELFISKWLIYLTLVFIVAVAMYFIKLPYTTSVSYQNYESYIDTEYYQEQVPYPCEKCNDVTYSSALKNTAISRNCISSDRVCEYSEQYCISTGSVCTNQQQYCCETNWYGGCIKWCNRCLNYNYPCNQYGTRCASWKNVCLRTDVTCKATLYNYETNYGTWQVQFNYYGYNNDLLTTKTEYFGAQARDTSNIQNTYTVAGDGSSVTSCSANIINYPKKNECNVGICYKDEQKSRPVTKWHYVARCRDNTIWLNLYEHIYYAINPMERCS